MTSAVADPSEPPHSNSSYTARDKSGVLKASNLIGATVQDTEGKKLGEIKDLVIDPLEGDIEYAILDFGEFLGVGDKYFAVPWDALKLSENQKYLILDVSKKVLKSAPGFPKDQWPDMSNREWIVTVYEFYDLPSPEDGMGGAQQKSQRVEPKRNDEQEIWNCVMKLSSRAIRNQAMVSTVRGSAREESPKRIS